ncbi:MAG: peptidase M1 [Sphingomonas sp.]|nr:peptidase M1 [Sphingomonas sp.]|tara:strand:- start:86 stop:1819 length:1734 start_codon:yes stop_codon:yes gene_type:complete
MARISLMLAASIAALTIQPVQAQDSGGLPGPGEPELTQQTANSGGPLDPAQEKVRFDSADLKFEIFPDRHAIAGVATLHFTAKEATDRLVIDLDRNLPVSAIRIDGTALPESAWSNPEGRMTVMLPRPLAAGESVAAQISYAGQPHVAVRAPWIGGFVWATTPDGKPWIATAVQMQGCDMFWPCIDYPTYEPDFVDLHITVPQGLSAPSNGVFKGMDTLPDGRTTWNWHAEHPTLYGVALNVGPYEEISGTYHSRYGNDIPMFFWHLPNEGDKPEQLFAEFAPTLDFFESVIGPYPFASQKLGVVETQHKGMEHQSINAYGNNYAKTANGFDDLFQHEFAHEWFANQLTASNWDDFWLHEGTGSYMQPLYGEWREGHGRYIKMMLDMRPGIRNQHPIVSGTPQSASDVYYEGPAGDIYSKGAWVLHTLRGLIGDEAFFNSLRLAIYGRTDPKPGNFEPVYRSTPEYIGFVNQEAGGDYQWFFDVYLYSAALPKLVQSRDGDTVTFTWQTEGDKPFPMPVDISVNGDVTTLPMTDGTGSITVPQGAHVIVDPESKILMQSDQVDAFQTYMMQRAQGAH